MTPLNLNLRLIATNFGIVMQLNQQAKKKVLCWLRCFIQFTKWKLDCYSPMKLGKIMSGIHDIP